MKDYTHICIVLDASGSMAFIEDDTKGSFNAFLKSQKEAGGKTVFDLYQFSDKVKDMQKQERDLASAMKTMLGINPKMHLVAPKSIARSEGKAVRVVDRRKLHD